MKKYLIFFLLTLFVACSEPEAVEIPAEILSMERMTAIMMDIQLIEGGIVVKNYNKTRKRDEITEYYKAIFKKHEISQKEFDRSIKFYTGHPGLLEEVYDGILVKLSEYQAEIENQKE